MENTAKPPYLNYEVKISCLHCKQEQIVQIRDILGYGAGSLQSVRCAKCERYFDAMVSGQIVGGPFLP
jgi:transcription elongation factor Elf1